MSDEQATEREHVSSKYSVDIDLTDPGSSHAIMVDLIGRGRDVLDIGCASGDLARILTARGCRVTGVEVDAQAAELARPALVRLAVVDLEQADLQTAVDGERYDVVVLGDVLEHLRDPLAVLRQVPGLLRPGGSVVVSIPNVAHASVRLSLLGGDFTYRSHGLLDETHLRFFTRTSVEQLLADAGLVPVDRRRTVLGPFDSEIPLRQDDVPSAVLDLVMQDAEAITYQFVWEAVADDGAGRARVRQQEADALRAEVEALRGQAAQSQAETEALRSALDELSARADEEQDARATDRAALSRALDGRRAAEQALAAVHASTAWRVSAPVRALGPLRAALQGPVATRRSLRRPGGAAAAVRVLREQGLSGAVARARRELHGPRTFEAYAAWVAAHDTLGPDDVAAIRRHAATELAGGPRISVVVPVHDTDPALLREAVASVQGQLYPHWQLCLADDASRRPDTRAILLELAGDPRVRVVRLEENAGIAGATNAALAEADGDLVAFMDHDDVLAPHALYLMALEAARHPDAALLYSDEDKLDEQGRRYDPYFKPGLDHELLLGQNYVSHLTVVRRSLVEQLGGLRTDVEGAQDHDLVLRVVAAVRDEQVRHVPHVLYHWRQFAGSGTFSSRSLDRATAGSRAAVLRHLEARGEQGCDVVPVRGTPLWNRVLRPLPQPAPGVTVVVPTRDRLELLRGCLDGLLHRTDYPALQVLVVDNDSSEPATLAYLAEVERDPRVRVLRVPGPFNYSAINNTAVEQVTTEALLLLNNDIVVRHRDWLREMVSRLAVPGTGAVGAKLLYGDGRVQHAGVVLGIGGVAGHSHKHEPGDSPGYAGRLAVAQTVSAVTAACLLTWTSVYREVGGLDAEHLAVAFNDVDLCLRIGAAGRRIVFTPFAVLDHLESASRGAEVTPEQVRRFNAEADVMRDRWGALLEQDPAYNPNLTLVHEDFTLASPPRAQRPWRDV